MSNRERACDEVVRMHAAIEGWVTGRLQQDRFEEEIAGFLGPGFRIVEPDGRTAEREVLLKGLRDYWGKNPAFRIRIENSEILEERGGLVIVTYLERQTGASLAKETNARRSTCALDVGERVTHLFLHETWVND
ncbi:MAG: hypothetical protein LJE62_15430 [Silicimonas sp.]|nr:hypothetical protein [Silicimonas sp.]